MEVASPREPPSAEQFPTEGRARKHVSILKHLFSKWPWYLLVFLALGFAATVVAYRHEVAFLAEEDRIACGAPSGPLSTRERRENAVERDRLQLYLDTNEIYYDGAHTDSTNNLARNILNARVERVVGHRAYLQIDAANTEYLYHAPAPYMITAKYTGEWEEVYNRDTARSDHRVSVVFMTSKGGDVVSTCRPRVWFGLGED